MRNLPELAGTLSSQSELLGHGHLFHVPLAALRRVCFHTDLPCRPQPPAPPTARTFPCRNLQELARTFMPELLLSLPPQKSNQTLLLSKLSSSSSIVGTCRTCRNLQEHAGACITCRNLPEPAGTCRNLQELAELAGTCRTCRNLWNLSELLELLGHGQYFTFPWPPRFAFASTLIYHSRHNHQHPCSPREASI